MAETPEIKLHFRGSCPDCGVREVILPAALADVGDDFDWLVRDYNGFRIFMLEELAARFPERKRWTPADLEVVLVEVFAAVLDQLSDMADRVATEAYLETARKPETVRQLLEFIGYDAVANARAKDQIDDSLEDDEAEKALENYWRTHPNDMDKAKRAGSWEIHTQKRMVTPGDFSVCMKKHPLVVNAHAWSEWSGSWFTMHLALISWENKNLDDNDLTYPMDMKDKIINFHQGVDIPVPDLDGSVQPSIRMILRPYIYAFRMAGQEVIMQDPEYVGIYMSLSVQIGPNHFQSEIRHAIAQVLGHGPGGFFEPGRIGFGEDLYASDVIQALMSLDGVENVCLNRFKRLGGQYPDRAEAGFIPLDGLEVALCNNDTNEPSNGYYRIELHGGRPG